MNMQAQENINNPILGTDENDTLVGGIGNDTIIGNLGDDLKIGKEGDDRLIWNNGDGSDTMEGDAGYDVTEVNGALEAGDDFELRANGDRVEFERLNLGNFVLDVDNVEEFVINGGGGDDTLNVKDLTGTDVQRVTFNGGDGNDSLEAILSNVAIAANGGAGDDYLSGSDVPEIIDTLEGGVGNDTIIGNRGNDIKIGGDGDDRLIWNNGDGSDIMEGDAGYDVTEVNGAVEAGDDFELRANGDRTEFERLNLGNFVLDVDNVEQFEINGGGGDDTLNVKDLTGTDVQQVIFDGGDGNDFLEASLGNVAIAANGGAGDDFLSGSSVPELIDTLEGGVGNDTIIGNRGNDIKIGGEGDDRLIWNNGDGSDIMEGDAGYDVTEVNGAVEAGDDFELRANGDRTEFERLNLGNFVLDVDNVEQFEINGGGGDDILTINDLNGTDVQRVIFDGGDGNDVAVFSGLRGDYEITLEEGSATVVNSANPDIINNLANVETIRFDNGDYNPANGEFAPTENAEPELDDDQVAVYRFFRTDTQTQFYTTSEIERDVVLDTLPQYEYEDVSFVGAAPPAEGEDISGANAVYRFFNRNTGVHVYTADENEKTFIEENLPNYDFEGTPYYGYETQQEGTVPLYRFYSQSLDAHFYTPSADERDDFLESSDYRPEGGADGIAFYVEPSPDF